MGDAFAHLLYQLRPSELPEDVHTRHPQVVPDSYKFIFESANTLIGIPMTCLSFLLGLMCLYSLIMSSAAMMPSASMAAWRSSLDRRAGRKRSLVVAAVLPGDPLVTGTLSLGLTNVIELYSNVILFRIALSWFPQLVNQFPILRPVFTVSEPYLKVFRSQIPTVAGFDISPIPALFCLNILSQTAAAIGAEIP